MGRSRHVRIRPATRPSPYSLPDSSLRCIEGSHVAREYGPVAPPERPRWKPSLNRFEQLHAGYRKKTVLPGLSPGSRGLSACTPHRVPGAGEPHLRLFVCKAAGRYSHCIFPSERRRILSCGTSRKGTKALSIPSKAPRATLLTPPWLTATVLFSKPASQAETRCSRSR